MKKSLWTLTFISLLLGGCNSTTQPKVIVQQAPKQYEAPTPQKQPIFQEAMIKVAKSTLNDPNYHKMALDTPNKKWWFKILMYRLWDRQITRDEFIKQGLERYPNKRYEFNFVANGFQKV